MSNVKLQVVQCRKEQYNHMKQTKRFHGEEIQMKINTQISVVNTVYLNNFLGRRIHFQIISFRQILSQFHHLFPSGYRRTCVKTMRHKWPAHGKTMIKWSFPDLFLKLFTYHRTYCCNNFLNQLDMVDIAPHFQNSNGCSENNIYIYQYFAWIYGHAKIL